MEEYQRNLGATSHPSSQHPPQIYSLPKVHKDGIHLYPSVALLGLPTYELAKKLARIWSPLTGKMEVLSGNTSKCADRLRRNLANVGDQMVSFDVVSILIILHEITCHKYIE